MRAQFLRTTSPLVLAVLLAAAGVVQTGAALAAAIVLPEVPVARVTVERADVTGSIAGPRLPPPGAGNFPLRLSPVLPFDDQATLEAPAAPLHAPMAATPAQAAPAGAPNLRGPASALADPTAPSGVEGSATAAAPPLDAPTGGTPAAAATAPQRGLSSAALADALTTFVAEKPEGETRSQTEERRKLRESIAAVYAARANAPLWIADAQLTPAARSILDRLDHAAEDGLDLRRFAVPVPRSDASDALARAELALSEAALAYARQATGSRVEVGKLGGIIDDRPEVADAARVLGTVPEAADAGEVLRAFNPPQPGYVALRDKLAEMRRRDGAEAQARIPSGPILKPGMSDARVPLIRARFELDMGSSDPTVPALVYDTRVAAAVAQFQRAKGLRASGILTPATVAMLSGGNPQRLENTILANMEEWRWLPRDLGADHIEVNIPDYTVRVIRGGEVTHDARVVVGQPDKPTPVFSQVMKFIIVNPYWNVPLSIIRKEMLPKLAADPDYFRSHGYETVERNGVTYVRQPPGEDNALGRIKFMFPNNHAVYLHDTNVHSVFGRSKRALSHGCVRVDQPFAFAEAVLGPDKGWTEARVKKMVGGTERTINLPTPLPIHIVYFTAFVDPHSGFQMRDDVYGYTGKIKLALGLQD